MKKDFIWFLANIYILANKKEFYPFIKENENIYQIKSRLPGNYGFGPGGYLDMVNCAFRAL